MKINREKLSEVKQGDHFRQKYIATMSKYSRFSERYDGIIGIHYPIK